MAQSACWGPPYPANEGTAGYVQYALSGNRGRPKLHLFYQRAVYRTQLSVWHHCPTPEQGLFVLNW